MLIEIIL